MSIGLQTQSRNATPQLGQARIAVCATDPDFRRRLADAFETHSWPVEPCLVDDCQLRELLEDGPWDGLLLDLDRVDEASKALLGELAAICPELGIVVSVPDAELTDSRILLDCGASAVTGRDAAPETVISVSILGAENARLRRELRSLAEAGSRDEEAGELIGCSPAIRRLCGIVDRAGENDATVLIEGKEGVGKTLVARLIHLRGRRAEAGFVSLHSQDTDEELLERGLREANGGTLLIEAVESLDATCQSRLVRFLKERGVANAQNARSDVRIIATTCARLAELTAKGTFREDLYYRLNMFPIVVPRLVERREDIPLLAACFVRQSSERDGLPDKGFTAPAMIMLEAHPWPGNVTQLRNSVLRAHALAEGGPIDRIHLFGPSTGVEPPPGVVGLSDSPRGDEEEELTEEDILPFQEEEKRLLSRALRATRGNVRRAAQLLGIGRATLYRKIQVYQLRLQ